MKNRLVLDALFLRPLVRRPWRFAITILGVAAGVASLVATLSASRAALYSLREGVTEIAGAAHLEIHEPGGVDDALLGRLLPVARDAVICPVIEEIVLCPKLADSVRLLGLDLAAELGVRKVEVAGDEPDSFADVTRPSSRAQSEDLARAPHLSIVRGEGAYIGRNLARDLALAVGDSIELEVHSRPVRLAVLGVFDTPGSGSAWDRVVVIDVARAQELVGRVGRLDRIEIAPRLAEFSLADLTSEVAPLVPPGCELLTPEDRRAQTNAIVRALEFNLNMISGISLFVAAVLVATTLATSVVQRRPTIALLSTLGAGKFEIARAVLVEAAAIGVLGGAAGVLLGHFGARISASAMQGTLATVVAGAPSSPIRFEWRWALIGIAAGLTASLGAACLPLFEALRTPPIQALRSERPEPMSSRSRGRAIAVALVLAVAFVELVQMPAWRGLPVAALAGAMCLMGSLVALCAPALDFLGRAASRGRFVRERTIAVRLALAGLSAGRRRAAWAAGAVGIAVALAVSIAAMVHSFRTTLVDWSAGGFPADLSVRPLSTPTGVPLGRLDPAIVSLAQSMFGPSAVDPFHRAEARFRGERITLGGAELAIIGAHGGVPLVDGRDPRPAFQAALAERGALVNEAFAHRFGVHEGERVTLDVRGGAIECPITGIFYDYGNSQGLAVIDRSEFLARYPDDGPREIAIFLPPESSHSEARSRFLRAIDGRFHVDVLARDEARARALAMFDRTFAITRALQLVAAAVAVIAVFSVLSALVFERRADVGLLGAVGASRAQVMRVVLSQSIILGLVGSLGGGVCGLLIGLVLVDVVNLQSFGWTLTYHQPWNALAAVIGSVLAACLLAASTPAIIAARSSLHDALREED